jgi:predicted lipoprotein
MNSLSSGAKRGIWIGVVVVILVLMGLGTKVVSSSSKAGAAPDTFSASAYGAKEFPKIQAYVTGHAVDLKELATALAADPKAAAAKYGVVEGTSAPVYSVSFTGVVGKGDAGVYPITVDGLAKNLLVRIQTGPAINGTDLRDASGTIHFPDFVNQIEYQDAGSAINNELKKKVLAKVDTANLAGKTVTVDGAFQLINPQAFLVTPVTITVG